MKTLILAMILACGAPWSLDDCINYALDHNITVQQSRILVEEREIALNTAKNRFLPGVSAGASQNFSFGRGLTADNTYANANTTSSSFSLGGELSVFQGLQLVNNVRLSRLDLEAATKDLEKTRDDIRVAVANAYMTILYNQEILSVAKSQQEVDSILVERMRSVKASGKASEADVAAQEATYAQSCLNTVQAQNNLRLSVLDLSQLLELDSPEGFCIVTPDVGGLELSILRNPEEIYAAALEIKPAIKAEEARVASAERNIAIAKGAFSPTLSLSGGIGSNFYTSSSLPSLPFAEQLRNNFSQYVGMSLNIPIFSRMSNANNLKTARLNYNSRQLQLENAKKDLYKEIQQAYYNAVASQSKMVSSGKAAESSSKSFELTKEKYAAGKADIVEYNQAKDKNLEALSNYIQARYECLFQTSLLDFYEGKPISFQTAL